MLPKKQSSATHSLTFNPITVSKPHVRHCPTSDAVTNYFALSSTTHCVVRQAPLFAGDLTAMIPSTSPTPCTMPTKSTCQSAIEAEGKATRELSKEEEKATDLPAPPKKKSSPPPGA